MRKRLCYFLSALLVFSTCMPGGTVRTFADDGGTPSAVVESSDNDNDQNKVDNSTTTGAQDSTSPDTSVSDGETQGSAAAANTTGTVASAAPSLAPASLTAVYVDGTNGNDDNDGSSFDGKAVKSLAKALDIQKANEAISTIYVKGNLSLSATVYIPSGVTLSIAADGATISGSGNSVDGIVLKSGSTLTGAGTLTMTGFKTALTSENGSTITDGTYVLKDNAGGNGTRGLNIAGTVRGTSKDRLTITAKDHSETNFYSDSAFFENCTISVASDNTDWVSWTLWGSWIDGPRHLNLVNTDMTVAGIGAGWYVLPNLSDSRLTVAAGPKQPGTGMTINGTGKISNSTIEVNAGYKAGISVGAENGTINVTNSTLEFNNGGTGGFNVNTGTVVLNNSIIKGDGRNSGALFGAQTNGSIVFGDNCLVETPGKSNADNGAGQTGKNFVVTGGSYLVKYAPDYNSNLGTIPTNGSANGDEKLSLFTLADASTQQLNPINANGTTYAYSVAKASSDGEKHVWVPAAKVTFKLNADDAEQKVDASFADGSTTDQTSLAMRGYALKDAKSVAGGSVALPTDPFAAGYKFAGWFYKDANGEEQQFSDAVKISSDVSVYAKWESDSSTYAVKYHNGASHDVTYLSTSSDPSRSLKVLSFDAVKNANSSFAISGKIFKGWNTKEDGTGDEVSTGSSLTVPTDTDVVDLYAVWEDQTVTVRFSANGGTFSNDSVFKKNPDVFDISTDKNGGEVATVKSSPKVSDKKTLNDLLTSLSGGKVSASTVGIATSSKTDNDPSYTGIATYKYHVLKNEAVENTFWGIPLGTYKYYYWFNDPSGDSYASYKDSNDQDVVLSQDVTYYLKWNDDPSVEAVSANFSLPSDMWGDSSKDTTSIKEVTAGDTFSLTGAIDASGIVDQMDSLENGIAGRPTDLTQISLSDTASSFTATITLPDGVVVPDKPKVSVNGLGDCFEVTETSVNGQAITVTFGLKGTYENYKQLKDAVATVGNGVSASEMKKPIAVTVDGLSFDADKVTNGEEITATGSVSGSFFSYAKNTISGKVKKYDYSWDGAQIQAAKDPRGEGIQQTILVVKPMDQKLPADILVGNDTEHESTYPVLAGQTIDFTGTIDASVVKGQMKGIEAEFSDAKDYEGIKLTDMSSSFTATFTIPEGLSLPENITKDSIKLDGFSDTFQVSDVSVSGKTVTITIKLKDGIKTYPELQEAVVTNLDDTMKVTLPGVRVDDDFPAGKTATVSGTVEGSFIAHATNSATDTTKVFSFTWEGVQTAGGMDNTANSVDDGIRFTVEGVSPVASNLPGDLLVGSNTTHDAVLESAQGSSFDLTGAVDVSSIKEQMEKIEEAYPNADHDGISLGNLNFSFVASFTVPDGMTLPTGLDKSPVKVADFGKGFKVSDVSASGKTVSVRLSLSDPSSIKTYSDLEKVVDGAGATDGWMRLTVPGIMTDKDATVGKSLTIIGTVDGAFSATADSESGSHKAFSFTWKGTQWADGKDSAATDDDTIQLTMKMVKGEEPNPTKQEKPVEPTKPVNPSEPSTPSNSENPAEQAGTSSMIKPKTPASVPDTGDKRLPVGTVAVTALCGVAALAVARRMRRRNN